MAESQGFRVHTNRISGGTAQGNPMPEDSNRVQPEVSPESMMTSPKQTMATVDRTED